MNELADSIKLKVNELNTQGDATLKEYIDIILEKTKLPFEDLKFCHTIEYRETEIVNVYWFEIIK